MNTFKRAVNEKTKILIELWHWFMPWIVMSIIIMILPYFGYEFDLRKTVKLQAEKLGFGIKDTKPPVFLTQEYPDVEGISYRESINLTVNPALMVWREDEQPFWVGIQNILKDSNYRNPTLFLNFNGKVDVRVDEKASAGWIETDPDFTYFIRFKDNIQPLTGIRINPLFIRFPREDIYFVQYTIVGDDKIPTQGIFPINVHKRIVVKKIGQEENRHD